MFSSVENNNDKEMTTSTHTINADDDDDEGPSRTLTAINILTRFIYMTCHVLCVFVFVFIKAMKKKNNNVLLVFYCFLCFVCVPARVC